MSTNPSVKFRPSLSAQQITTLVDILSTYPEHTELCKVFRVFKLKADHGIVTPSHVSIGRPSIEQSLGFSDDTTPDASIEVLLQMYEANPSILSRTQMDKVEKHRYVNDLMTPEEESQYESSTGV